MKHAFIALKITLRTLQPHDSRKVTFFGHEYEFHISRESRKKYQVDEALFTISGNVIIPNFHVARALAERMNRQRDLTRHPEQAVKAGQLNAMGLIDEIFHYVVELYRQQVNPETMKQAIAWLEEKVGSHELSHLLLKFVEEFPPLSVHRGELSAEAYLEKPVHRQMALEELLMLYLANGNPAFGPFRELFDDSTLRKTTRYTAAMDQLHHFFDTQPPFGPDNQNLVEMLQTPARLYPNSLSAQLEYIRTRWGLLLSKFLLRLLSSMDFIKEEEKAVFAGPGPTRVYQFAEGEEEPEQFSPDLHWMPRLVLIAKSTYVWLDQLSKKYQRPITRLDQIPDQELDQLARWGFTGLWLIGLWERSKASRRIKQLCGNPEAVASAYSLFDYEIAAELGGEEAFWNLRERAWQRGIRLGGDMVPNHMGIDSRWVMEHPDWFISLDYSPFPSYTFNGPNLSWHPDIGIYIEDHYYDRSDAAVVFKRVDFRTGDTRYIYHGNDGTSMPWNDTAQLDYLKAEVREAVIQTILQVARKFPIIRFDAAMTLTKKHFQRLWYPEPGTGGDIPSRAEHGLTREQFDALMPKEFWREVVDRVAQEAPDTLLLAEAFWLMESYFVRTLGMHRVYNSAFMNMLKNEENAKYRESIKNVLQFNPEILKRFVNFMNNPDEETAVVQFGKGDKYFGVCTLMVTMPGLPMFGHGQVEGFAEKYGMEYRRAYWDEHPDPELIRRHEREIFPLMRKRYLFAEVQNFLLYDFFTAGGNVNENVFAYSNRFGEERALVVYNNKFENTAGWIRTSVGFVTPEDKTHIIQKTLGEGLALPDQENCFVIFREHISGLEFIRSCRDIHQQGLYVELRAYQTQVFLDFRIVYDDAYGHYHRLHRFLNGRGVPDIHSALREILLAPIHTPLRELASGSLLPRLFQAIQGKIADREIAPRIEELEQKLIWFLREIKQFTNGKGDEHQVASNIRKEAEALVHFAQIAEELRCKGQKTYRTAIQQARQILGQDSTLPAVLLGWLLVHRTGEVVDPQDAGGRSRSGMEEWLLEKPLREILTVLLPEQEQMETSLRFIRLLTGIQEIWRLSEKQALHPTYLFDRLLADPDAAWLMGINRYNQILWYNKEGFERLVHFILVAGVLVIAADTGSSTTQRCRKIAALHRTIKALLKAEQKSEFQVEKLRELLSKKTTR